MLSVFFDNIFKTDFMFQHQESCCINLQSISWISLYVGKQKNNTLMVEGGGGERSLDM